MRINSKWAASIAVVGGIGTAAGLVACSGDKNDYITVVVSDGGAGTTPVTTTDGAAAIPAATGAGVASLPTGFVSGIVYDGSSAKPLTGVAVTVTVDAKAYTGTTDANGLYSIPNVPATTVWVQYSIAGYADAFFSANPSTGSVTNFGTVNNTVTQVNPVGLLKTTGTFSLRILTDAGTPASGVTVRGRQGYRYLSYSNGNATAPAGAWDVVATSGADGYANFTGLIDVSTYNTTGTGGALLVDIAPTSVGSGNSSYSFLGVNNLAFNLLALTNTASSAGGAPFFVLAGPSATLTVVQSNVDAISSGNSFAVAAVTPVPGAGPLTIDFNQAINPDTVHASLINEDGSTSSITLAPTVSVNELSLAPSAPFAAGARYNLDLSVDPAFRTGNASASARSYATFSPFFVTPPSSAVSVMSAVNDPFFGGGVTPTPATGHVIVTFSEPVGIGRGLPSNIGCAVFFATLLNGNAAIPYGAEYAPGLTPVQSWPLQCFNTGNAPGFASNSNGTNNAQTDFTQLGYIEGAPSYVSNAPRLASVKTGFSSRWLVNYGTASGACQFGVTATTTPACVPPTTGTIAHLSLSTALYINSPTQNFAVTRANGEPLPDTLSFALP